jgi:hypothetical protein
MASFKGVYLGGHHKYGKAKKMTVSSNEHGINAGGKFVIEWEQIRTITVESEQNVKSDAGLMSASLALTGNMGLALLHKNTRSETERFLSITYVDETDFESKVLFHMPKAQAAAAYFVTTRRKFLDRKASKKLAQQKKEEQRPQSIQAGQQGQSPQTVDSTVQTESGSNKVWLIALWVMIVIALLLGWATSRIPGGGYIIAALVALWWIAVALGRILRSPPGILQAVSGLSLRKPAVSAIITGLLVLSGLFSFLLR